MDHAGPRGGPKGSLTANQRGEWVGVIVPEPTPPSSDRWPSRPTHKRPIAKILTGSPSLLPQQSLATLWMPAGASQLRDSLSLSGARSNRSNKGAIRRHLRPQSGSTSGASSRWEEAGRGAEGQAGAHICDELATEAGLSGRRRRPPVGRAICAPSAAEFRRADAVPIGTRGMRTG